MTTDPNQPSPSAAVGSLRSALRIALIYALFGFGWIIFSDTILSWLVKDPRQLTSIQTYKGWFYVAVTAWLIFGLVRARLVRIEELNRSLHEQQSFFRTLIDRSPLAMVAIDADENFQHVNERFIDLFGYTREDCSSVEAWWPLAYPDEKTRARIQADWERSVSEAQASGRPIQPYEARVACKSGAVRDIRFHLRQVGDLGILTFEDVTDTKTMWRERLELEARLAQSNRLESLGVMAGGIAHDFNNILAAIIGYGEMAQADLTPEDPARDSVDKVLSAADRARGLVRQILAFSRRDEQQLFPLDLTATVKEAMSLVTATLPATVAVTFKGEAEDLIVQADRTQIHQIVFNLCTNAYHAMPGGEGAITVEVAEHQVEEMSADSLNTLEPGPHGVVRVTDDGAGMDETIRTRIFEPFFTTKATGKGIGMGLSVVHGVVGAHGGAIEVESTPGRGTTFSVYLPRLEGDVTLIPEVVKLEREGGQERVLFVDDEPMLADLGQRTLESLGYQVVAETSPVRALEMFSDTPDRFDLIVTDQNMPHKSGLELVRECRAIRPDVPVIICTGFRDGLDKSTVQAAGVAGVLQKPITLDILASAVRSALGH